MAARQTPEPQAARPPAGNDERPAADTSGAVHLTPGPGAPALLLAPGMRPLPEYELVRLLGRGGYGEAWQATGPGGFAVALKFIRLGTPADGTELRSIEVMRDIHHPHLLPLFGAWQRDDCLIVAMELAEGTLLDRLREAQAGGLVGIPRGDLLEYMRDAARGIDYLNEPRHLAANGARAGIQHKDIKPQNLLLVGGSVKVGDFGLARVLEHTATTASGGGLTPGYAPPEFFQARTTRWSDQYSLAVTYCHLRGGRRPFGGTPLEVMMGHSTRPPDLTMLPEEERPAVERALAKQPEQRWPDCRGFVEALAAAAAGGAAVNSVPPVVSLSAATVVQVRSADLPQPEPWWLRPRAWLAAGVLGGLSLAAAMVGYHLAPGGSAGRDGSAKAAKTTSPEPAARAPQLSPTRVPVADAPHPSLTLAAVAEVALGAGRSVDVAVRLERHDCPGPVQVTVQHLPSGVTAQPPAIPRGEDTGIIHLLAEDTVGLGRYEAVLTAAAGDVRGQGKFRLTVVYDRQAEARLIGRLKDEGWRAAVVPQADGPARVALTAPAQPSEADLALLKCLPGLHKLDISATQTTDRALGRLAALAPGLHELRLNFCLKLTDEGLKHLRGFTELQSLSLNYTDVTDKGLRHLKAAAPHLRSLSLYGCRKITGTGVTELEGLAELDRLDVRDTDLRTEALDGLHKARPRLEILAK
jgi:serine/threonine protein kinase